MPVDALAWLAERVPVRPVARGRRRRPGSPAREGGARAAPASPTAPWAAPPRAFAAGTVVKRRTGGYDGRGQVVLAPGEPVDGALDGDVHREELVAFDRELSIVAARGVDGTMACYPVVENRHADGILRTTLAPAPGLDPGAAGSGRGDREGAGRARSTTSACWPSSCSRSGGALIANEVAPRVHNSGHWTIDGADTSQFEQHLRAIVRLAPRVDRHCGRAVAMVNLIGAAARRGRRAGRRRRPPPPLRQGAAAGPQARPRERAVPAAEAARAAASRLAARPASGVGSPCWLLSRAAPADPSSVGGWVENRRGHAAPGLPLRLPWNSDSGLWIQA